MIELSITAKTATIASPATPVSGRAAGDFARALGTLLVAPPDTQSAPSATDDARQRDAVGGNNLPAPGDAPALDPVTISSVPIAKSPILRRLPKADGNFVPVTIVPGTVPSTKPSTDIPASDDAVPATDATTEGETTDDMTQTAPAIAFFAPAPPIAIEPSILPATVEAARGRDRAAPGVTALTLTGTSPAAAATPAAALDVPAAPDTVATAATAATAVTNGATVLPDTVQLLDRGADAPVTAATTTVSSVVINPRIAASAGTPRFTVAPAMIPSVDAAAVTVLPARQAFAAALAALSPRPPARDDDSRDSQEPIGALAGLAAPTGGTMIAAAPPQVGDGQGAALDLRHDRGLRGMIDHIETLRDDANARDTRIRLVPDALGTVEVAVRRDGDAVHVRFSSASEATRVVLNDAQPRLAQLAEASGLRIAGSSVDSGTGGQPQPRTPTPSPRPDRAPRVAAAREGEDLTDQRLA